MLGCGVTEGGGVYRAWFGKPPLLGGFPDGRCERLESGGRGDLQGAQWPVGADEECMRHPHGQQHEIARPRTQGVLAAAELGMSGQQVEHFVLLLVPMQWRGEPWRIEELDHRHPAAGLGRGGFDRDEVAEKPQRPPFLRPAQVGPSGHRPSHHRTPFDRQCLIIDALVSLTVTDVKRTRGTRRYTSTVREQSAQRTRQAIMQAAAELFVTRGFAATSLADIAAAAQVARPTVFAAFGSKAAVLHHVLDQALAGDDEPIPVADRPWFRPVWEAATPALVLDAYAVVCTLIGARAAPIFEAVRRAAHADAEVARLWSTTQHNRRAGAEMVIKHARRRGPLRTGLPTSRAVDLLWIFNDPAHYHALVIECEWSERSFTRWLADQMRHNLLPLPHAPTRATRRHGNAIDT